MLAFALQAGPQNLPAPMRHIHEILGQFSVKSICQQMLAVLQHGHGILSVAMLTQQQELLAACFEEVCEQVRRCLASRGSVARHAAVQQLFGQVRSGLCHVCQF